MAPTILLVSAEHGDVLASEFGRYVRDYEISVAPDLDEAFTRAHELEAAGGQIALMVVESSVFEADLAASFQTLRHVSPTAKRVITAHWDRFLADASTFRPALAKGKYDAFLLMPRGVRDEEFHAAITDLLSDWGSTVAEPEVETVRLVSPPGILLTAGTSSMIRNYLGFPRGISGMRLAQRARNQAIRFGTRFFTGWEVTALDPCEHGDHHVVHTDGGDVHARTVVIATGVAYRRLPAPGVEDFLGRGVTYGSAMSAAREMDGSDVVVVGGGNSAGQAAIHLARFATSVTVMVRRPDLTATMSQYLISEIEYNPRITVTVRSEVVAAGGSDRLGWIDVLDHETGGVARRNVDGLFLFLGAEPRCDWLPSEVARDEHGFVLTGRDVPTDTWVEGLPPANLATTMPGVFAVGDIRAGSMKRVAAASGEGASVVPLVHAHLGLDYPWYY